MWASGHSTIRRMRKLAGTVASAAVGYVIGTMPSADIVTRAATGGRMNIRQEGTGNPGAANVAGVLGKKWGAVVMVADVVKGFAAAKVGARMAGSAGLHVGGPAAVAGPIVEPQARSVRFTHFWNGTPARSQASWKTASVSPLVA